MSHDELHRNSAPRRASAAAALVGVAMGKLIFWAVIIALVLGGYRFMQLLERKSAATQRRNSERKQQEARELVLSSCAHCAVYVPESDAVVANGQVYCCQEHSVLGPRKS